jgi:DNA replication and repair protein RecF
MVNKSSLKKDIHMYGSRSEQRLGLFWLKINELKYLENFFKKKPILLLDDIFSELDHNNQKLIFNLIGNYQTVVTSTEKEVVKLINLSDDTSYDTIDL